MMMMMMMIYQVRTVKDDDLPGRNREGAERELNGNRTVTASDLDLRERDDSL